MPVKNPEECPICKQTADGHIGFDLVIGNLWGVECPRCGSVHIDERVVKQAEADGTLHLLSAFFKRQRHGFVNPNLGRWELSDYLDHVTLRSPTEQADLLLQELAKSTYRLGWPSNFNSNTDYPLLTAKDSREVEVLLAWLGNAGYVDNTTEVIGVLTLRGWQRVEELQNTGRESFRAFVAMSFNPALTGVYDEGIKPAIMEAGYQPIRIDRVEHVNSIDDEIVAGIRGARFMVADFTENRSGVYFEAGFMQGLARNVFWICKRADLGNVHFDVRQFNFIDYGDAEELRTRLKNRILAVEGPGAPIAVRRAV
jgi:hypothetical protein